MIKIKQKSDSGIFTSPTSDVDWGGHRIFNLGDPIDLKDAVNEQYLAKAVSAIGSRYYMLNTDSGIGSYKLCSSTPSTGDEQSLSVTDLTDGQEIGGWIAPNAGEPPKLIVGVYNWRIYAEKTAGTQTLRLYWKLIERKSDTSEVEIATSVVSNEIVTGKNSYIIPLTLNADYEVAPDSYVACKVFAEVSGGGSAPAVSLYFEGNSASHFQIPANTEALDSHYAHIDLGNVSDSSVLDKIKNVDGEGSGLDADTVRTFPASQSPQANTIPVTDDDSKLTIFIKDDLRVSVEAATGGRATVMYDDKGLPCYMVCIPAFNLEDIDPDLGTGLHPAFIVNGVEKSEIWIGMFPVTDVIDGRAYCLPGRTPAVNMTYDQAKSYCEAKGTGWHLMTIHEWAAVTLWCLKNGFQPRGNTNYGRSHEMPNETAVRSAGGAPGDNSVDDGKTLVGTGPATWRHDGTPAGISDLVGNVWEWMHLFKLVDGRIYVPAANDFDLDESNWTAQDAYFDSPVAGDGEGNDNLGETTLSDAITNYAGPTGDNSDYDYNYDSVWNTLNIKDSWDPPAILKQLCIAPKKYDGTSTSVLTVFQNAKGAIWVRNYGERFPSRGGPWHDGSYAGIAALALLCHRSHSYWNIGCRPAFIT